MSIIVKGLSNVAKRPPFYIRKVKIRSPFGLLTIVEQCRLFKVEI